MQMLEWIHHLDLLMHFGTVLSPGVRNKFVRATPASLESSVIWGEGGRVSQHLSPGWGPGDLSRAAGRVSDFTEPSLQAKSSPLAKNGFHMLNRQKVVCCCCC